jgi:hypothetical protein
MAACGSSSSRAAGPTTTGKATSAVKLTEADNNQTVGVLGIGGHVQLVLGSTYWYVRDSSNPAVVRLDSQPVVKPQIQGCVPGQGCGTVTATFTVTGSGTATITATRSSCGEALRCTGTAGRYQVHVRVP